MMFEVYDAPALHISIPAILAHYAAGRVSGINIDSGDGVSHIVAVYEGCLITPATQRIDMAGSDLTDYLMRLLSSRGYTFSTSSRYRVESI